MSAAGVVVLGVTGSIGSQALEVAEGLGLPILGVAAGHRSEALEDVLRRHPEARVAVADPGAVPPAGWEGRFAAGEDAVAELAALRGAIVVNGIVGFAGLRPTLAALEAGNRVALANKESLVAGGPLVEAARRRGGGTIVPVDSEHAAIFQCLVGERIEDVARFVITASGGPFRGRSRAQLARVSPSEALAHPTWKMGPRITVDSATLMNKAFEVIEANRLFGLDYDRIAVVVHPQSFVHSLVEFVDGTVKAELGPPDMRKPIQYALTAPTRRPAPGRSLHLAGVTLTFEEPDVEVFRCLALGYEAGRRGGTAPAVLNAADEVAVAAFLEGRIGFLDIAEVVAETLDRLPATPVEDLDLLVAVDREARGIAGEIVARRHP
ncbi:MAG TPA: 1-deoxy-D-xylulose-5-phosphate reductoisomerase [Actinobacteria bacterium]|nr:1-deoxy-D-xylulose-5-phosphate reductoisomerase [Actinomycetota bacterium]